MSAVICNINILTGLVGKINPQPKKTLFALELPHFQCIFIKHWAKVKKNNSKIISHIHVVRVFMQYVYRLQIEEK